MSKDEMIVKYTLMPFNEEEDYEHFFSLSLREFAKNTKDKSLLAPLIVYNSDLDVPMDNDLEDYTVYCNKEQILEVIKRQEINDVFRTLIIHGFDVSMDDLKDTYIGIARRNNADLCINIIQDTGIDSNITLYIDSSIEKSEGKVWEMQKQEMYDEIDSFIENYDSYEVFDYSDYTPEEIESVENFLDNLFSECGMDSLIRDKKKAKESNKKELEEPKENDNKVIPLNTPPKELKDYEHENIEVEEDVISYSFENNGDVVSISCIDRDMFIITENDYEVALTTKQMDFIVNMYDMIIDYLDNTKPRK
jgi:hypothetical protein